MLNIPRKTTPSEFPYSDVTFQESTIPDEPDGRLKSSEFPVKLKSCLKTLT